MQFKEKAIILYEDTKYFDSSCQIGDEKLIWSDRRENLIEFFQIFCSKSLTDFPLTF